MGKCAYFGFFLLMINTESASGRQNKATASSQFAWQKQNKNKENRGEKASLNLSKTIQTN